MSKVLPHYCGAVVDFLDRETGEVKRMMMYPVTRIELQRWTGQAWVSQEIFQPTGEHPPQSDGPVKWSGIISK